MIFSKWWASLRTKSSNDKQALCDGKWRGAAGEVEGTHKNRSKGNIPVADYREGEHAAE